MKLNRGCQLLSLFGVLGVAVAGGQELVQEAIPNWSAPATWSPTRTAGLHTLANVTSPLPFIGVTPCRVADTRGNGFTGAYGPPSLIANATRTFTITGQCGIPDDAEAVSFNFGALNVSGAGDLRVFPAGGTIPLVSTLNYNASTPNIANAAIVALGVGAIRVQADAVSIDLIIDVNGYYAPAGVGVYNTFLGLNAGNFTMTGDFNTAVGHAAFFSNTTGYDNTAIGGVALYGNTTGKFNTAMGEYTLYSNGGGNDNTAVGYEALYSNFGASNTAMGFDALYSNNGGGDNTAVGLNALYSNAGGNANTALGVGALYAITGSNNIGIGNGAGSNQTTGSHDIYIGNAGVSVSESNTIRIGDVSFQDGGTIITGISGLSSIGGAPVYVNSGGRMGTSLSSSWHFKDDIRDIADESDGLMRLRPVAFKYKPEFDPAGLTQYGLIAEEVAEVSPDLVTCDRAGQPEGVRYHLIAPLLLNEVQKQHRTVEAQERTIEQQKVTIDAQQAEIEGLKARMSRLEARLIAEPGP
jgi:Chaperone of endosialidase